MSKGHKDGKHRQKLGNLWPHYGSQIIWLSASKVMKRIRESVIQELTYEDQITKWRTVADSFDNNCQGLRGNYVIVKAKYHHKGFKKLTGNPQ